MRILLFIPVLLFSQLLGERVPQDDNISNVVHGTTVVKGEIPFIVKVKQGSGSCTGILVFPHKVLTAGHCVGDGPSVRTRGRDRDSLLLPFLMDSPARSHNESLASLMRRSGI